MKKKLKNKKGQVAVEFIMMFVLCVSVVIYVFYFCYSLASLEYKTYVGFMAGRAISSSSPSYSDKKDRADNVINQFNTTASHYGSTMVTGPLQCNFDSSNGYRGIMEYGAVGVDYYVVSNAGVACQLPMPYVMPSLLTKSMSGSFSVGLESMTGSEISDKHCNCALDFSKNWKSCLSEEAGSGGIIDNGC